MAGQAEWTTATAKPNGSVSNVHSICGRHNRMMLRDHSDEEDEQRA